MKNKESISYGAIFFVIIILILLICITGIQLNEAKEYNTIADQKLKTAEQYLDDAKSYYQDACVVYTAATRKEEMLDIVHQLSDETNIAPELILAMIKVESNFKEDAIYEGCSGLMQISPIHNVANVFDIKTNITFGVNYVANLLNDSDNIYEALGRYNMGTDGYNAYVQKTGNKVTAYAEKVMNLTSNLQP